MLLGDSPGLWDRNLGAPQDMQAQPVPPGRLQVPQSAAAAGFGTGGCGKRGEKGWVLCPRAPGGGGGT